MGRLMVIVLCYMLTCWYVTYGCVSVGGGWGCYYHDQNEKRDLQER